MTVDLAQDRVDPLVLLWALRLLETPYPPATPEQRRSSASDIQTKPLCHRQMTPGTPEWVMKDRRVRVEQVY